MPGLLFLWSFLSLLTEKAYNGLFKSISLHRFHQSINFSSTGSSRTGSDWDKNSCFSQHTRRGQHCLVRTVHTVLSGSFKTHYFQCKVIGSAMLPIVHFNSTSNNILLIVAIQLIAPQIA